MIYRFSLKISEYGAEEDYAERVLDAFVATHPEVGTVVAQNVRTHTLTVTFSLEADNADAAIERARQVVSEGGATTGLPMTEVLEATVSLVRDDEWSACGDHTRELQPA